MARCRCGLLSCSCQLIGGDGVDVTGSGYPDDPYVISGQGSINGLVQVTDTASVRMKRTGSGVAEDPYVISGDVIIGAILQLVDDGDIIFDVTGEGSTDAPLIVSARLRCLSCTDTVNVGDVLLWDGTLGRYVPGPAPTAPFGSITIEAGGGLTGTGTGGTPLRLDICTYDELAALCEPTP